MADTKVTDLTTNTAPSDTDYLYMVEDPLGSPQGRNVEVSALLRLAYGYVSVTGGAASQTPTAATWTKVTQFTAELSGASVTADHANDKITIAKTGTYLATWQCSFTGAADEYRFAIYLDGVITTPPVIQTIPDANEHHVTVSAYVPVASTNLDLTAYVYSVAGSAFAVKESVLMTHRIG